MRSKLLFSLASGLCLSVLFSSSANAFGVINPIQLAVLAPPKSIDLGRSITGIIQGVITFTGDGEAKAELIAVQQQANTNADGTGDWSPNPSATGDTKPTALTNGAYDYVKSEILDQTDLSKYRELQNNLSRPTNVGHSQETCRSLPFTTDRARQTCMAVVNTFFADKGEENDASYENQIQRQRQEYANTIAPRFVTLGYTVQQKIIRDLSAAAQAPVAGNNEIASIANDGQTLDEMLKITVADLALQIEMMEADAMAFLLQQPVQIMPPENPNVVN